MLAVLAPLLSLLGIEAATITANIKRQAIVWSLIGVLGVVCVVFLLVAANVALSGVFGPVIAPLIIAVAAVLIALAIFLVAHVQDNRAAREAAEKQKKSEMAALVTTAVITAVPLILRSSLVKDVGLPAGAALVSTLLGRRGGHRHHR